MNELALKNQLEELYSKYNHKKYLEWDPLGMLSPKLSHKDFEVLSLLAAGLAYGRVEQARKSYSNLVNMLQSVGLSKDGKGIHKYIKSDFNRKGCVLALHGWKHRLNTHLDIVDLFFNLHKIYEDNKSLAELFQNSWDPCAKTQIENFCHSLAPMKKLKRAGTGASWFAASPQRGSSCKRFLLWLKWMIRKDEIDPGLWQNSSLLNSKLPKPDCSRLFIPVDTHLYKWGKQAGATNRKSIAWPMVEDITMFLTKINPHDPARYDFAICHEGIMKFRGLD